MAWRCCGRSVVSGGVCRSSPYVEHADAPLCPSGADSLCSRTKFLARSLFTIICSLVVRGRRPERGISFPTRQLVESPSSWADVMASSIRELTR